nr:UbiA family prenyltransferase [Streptomyces davaonensis]
MGASGSSGDTPHPAFAADVAPDPAEPTPGRRSTPAPNLPLAWAELLRLPALFTVPGDALAGAAATSVPHNSRTLLAIGSSLFLYEAGMALNDWADREEDAAERPHRPLPSGRIRPAAALTAACALTATGLALAARAGRPALSVAVPLAATVWAYDLHLKHTPAGPAAMATARALDLLLGAAATAGRIREALPSAALLGTHTLTVTTISRHETQGGSSRAPLAALAATAALSTLITRGGNRGRGPGGASEAGGTADGRGVSDVRVIPTVRGARSGSAAMSASHVPGTSHVQGTPDVPGTSGVRGASDTQGARTAALAPTPARPRSQPALLASALRPSHSPLRQALATAYAATTARAYFHAALNPSPPLTQRAVGAGIRATIPLQAALAARSGGTATALVVAALAPLGRRFARKVSIT